MIYNVRTHVPKSEGDRTIFAGEERSPTEHFRENTPDTPNINRLCILLKSEHNFRRPIPPRRHIFSHKPGIILRGIGAPCQSKVTDFEIAVGIEQQVGGFQVTVEDVGRMHCLESAEGLVNEVLAVVVGEVLSANDAVHICFHELLDEIDFREGIEAAGFLDFQNGDDLLSVWVKRKRGEEGHIFVAKVSQQFHFSKGTKTEHGMIKRSNLFNRYLLPARFMQSRPKPQKVRITTYT